MAFSLIKHHCNGTMQQQHHAIDTTGRLKMKHTRPDIAGPDNGGPNCIAALLDTLSSGQSYNAVLACYRFLNVIRYPKSRYFTLLTYIR